MAERLKFIVAYDGRPFAGWQSQAGGNTVQDHLESALGRNHSPADPNPWRRPHRCRRPRARPMRACRAAAEPDASGTMDRRVEHAPAANNPCASLQLRASFVPRAVFGGGKGIPLPYLEWTHSAAARAWPRLAPADVLDVDAMRREAAAFVGRHDFAAFAANRGRPDDDTMRTIESVRLHARGRNLVVEFSGDGFLYKMVRLMVGALVRCARGQAPPADIARRLRDPTSSTPADRLVAPAEGLFLVRVRY
jgi:tRNA pseudouridine38-40 synthase